MPIAEFYTRILRTLDELGIEAPIHPHPNGVESAIPFAEDHDHASYDGEAAALFWRQLLHANRVMGEFRSHFVGKVSPVHFFWGAMDLACTRLSGRSAPPHPGGGEEGVFYAYAYAEPDGFADYPVGPKDAYFSSEFKQFLLPYEAVRVALDPERAVTEFLPTTYEAAAVRGQWDRPALEDDPFRWDGTSSPRRASN
ncbi:DUF5996 family protein [Streptomyces milbemycinicus]